jgi:hypothetical protein
MPALRRLAAERGGEQDEDRHDDPADGHDTFSHESTPAGEPAVEAIRPVRSARSLIAARSVGRHAYAAVISRPAASYIEGW